MNTMVSDDHPATITFVVLHQGHQHSTINHFSARQHIAYMLSALYAMSVHPSVCHTGGSVKSG